MESERKPFLEKIYNLINNEGRKYGDFKKCELHIHTPESKCFRFITPEDKLDTDDDLENTSRYSEMSLEEILAYGKEISFFNEYEYKKIIENVDEYKQKEIVKEVNGQTVKYKSYKEYITYEMIAYKLYKENINVGIISDHNTISGYNKLLCAINVYRNRKTTYRKHKLKLFVGVEISCSDKNHLMVIVDSSKIDKLQKVLDEIIMGDNLGAYLDTRTIIKKIKELNAIAYIAHANSSGFYGNDVYKKELLNLEDLNGFGIKELSHKENIINRTRKYNKSIDSLAYVLEADSHSINELGRKNCWIKLSNMDFNSLKKAFLNNRVCISNEKPIKTNIQIKGLVVEKGERGFLGGNPAKEEKYMVIDFSSDLNCIIGGRGTGKSTILNVLEIIYSRETDDLEMLNFISQHKRIFSVFSINNEEYILDFLPQVELKRTYNLIPEVNKDSYYKKRDTYRLKEDWYSLFKISKKNSKNIYTEVKKEEISSILKSVFKRTYNINKLVDRINNNKISDYIRDVITNNVNYSEINTYISKLKGVKSTSLFKEVREAIDGIIDMIERRKVEFENKVKEFNEKNIDVLEIRYKPISDSNEFFDEFLEILVKERTSSDFNRNSYYKEADSSICNTYLRWCDLQRYLNDAVQRWSYFEVLKMLLNNKLHIMNKELPLIDYEGIEEKYSTIERGFQHIDTKNIKQINKQILGKFTENKKLFRESLINCFKVIDNFEMFFNVNYKEDELTLPKNFKNIKFLSSGQKVAALLTFVLNFGILTDDSTPLIIDQPEDNLDNTYIYKTLVESLKRIKNRRQIIIVTHSSTIVINADAEEVIVLKSDNDNGWIEKHGYPSDKKITRQVINYLEGGRDSFTHKYNMYKTILGM